MAIVAAVIVLCVLVFVTGLIYERLDSIAGGLSKFLMYGLLGSLGLVVVWVGINALHWALGN